MSGQARPGQQAGSAKEVPATSQCLVQPATHVRAPLPWYECASDTLYGTAAHVLQCLLTCSLMSFFMRCSMTRAAPASPCVSLLNAAVRCSVPSRYTLWACRQPAAKLMRRTGHQRHHRPLLAANGGCTCMRPVVATDEASDPPELSWDAQQDRSCRPAMRQELFAPAWIVPAQSASPAPL